MRYPKGTVFSYSNIRKYFRNWKKFVITWNYDEEHGQDLDPTGKDRCTLSIR